MRLKSHIKAVAYAAAIPLREMPLPGRGRGYTRFAIVSVGRSGTTLLVERLKSHPEITCYGELMGRDAVHWMTRWKPVHRAIFEQRERDPVAFLDRHVWHRHPNRIKAVGFKLLYDHLARRPQVLRDLCVREPGLRILHLRRRNPLKTFVSGRIAQRTGVFAVRGEQSMPAQRSIAIDFEEFRTFVRDLEVLDALHTQALAGLPTLDMTYEEFVADLPGHDGSICAHLGISHRPLQSATRKMARSRLRDRIENFDEVRATAQGTPLAWCFDDG